MTQDELNIEIDSMAKTMPAVRALRDAKGYDPENWPKHLREQLFERLSIRPIKNYEPVVQERSEK